MCKNFFQDSMLVLIVMKSYVGLQLIEFVCPQEFQELVLWVARISCVRTFSKIVC